jgi:hypothetical protein
MVEAKDYLEDDAEEVVLSRWGKIKQWIEIVMATKKVAMLIWGLVFAAGGSVVVGQATDTRPIRDAAVAMGILEEAPREILGNDEIYGELSNLIEDVERLEALVAAEHTHAHAHAPHQHDTTHEHQEIDLRHTHSQEPHSHPAAPASVDVIRAEILKILPDNHRSLH